MDNIQDNKEKVIHIITEHLQNLYSYSRVRSNLRIKSALISKVAKTFKTRYGSTLKFDDIEILEKDQQGNDKIVETIKDLRNANAFFVIVTGIIKESTGTYKLSDMIFHCINIKIHNWLWKNKLY